VAILIVGGEDGKKTIVGQKQLLSQMSYCLPWKYYPIQFMFGSKFIIS